MTDTWGTQKRYWLEHPGTHWPSALVTCVSRSPGFAVLLLGFSLVLFQGSFVHHSRQVPGGRGRVKTWTGGHLSGFYSGLYEMCLGRSVTWEKKMSLTWFVHRWWICLHLEEKKSRLKVKGTTSNFCLQKKKISHQCGWIFVAYIYQCTHFWLT